MKGWSCYMGRKPTSGNFVVPPEILALKPSNIPTNVKLIQTMTKKQGLVVHYYVYEALSVQDPTHPNKKKNASGRLLGKIEGGEFCPNSYGIQVLSRKDKSASNQNVSGANCNEKKTASSLESKPIDDHLPEEIAINMNLDLKDIDRQIKEYGQFAIAMAASEPVFKSLNQVFSAEDSRRIYVLGLIYFVEEYTPASYARDIFASSILSNKWPSIAISENNVNELLTELGLHPAECEKYSQKHINAGSRLTAIDGHVILSCSENNELADFGYKYQALKNMQINILEAYDVENGLPLTSKAYDGSIVDKISVQDIFDTYTFQAKTTFLIDSGFYSETDLKLYRSNDSFFVIPVPANQIIYKAMTSSLTFTGVFSYERKDEHGKSHSVSVMYRESSVKDLIDIHYESEKKRIEKLNEEEVKKCGPNEKPKKHYLGKKPADPYENDRVIMFRDEEMRQKLIYNYQEQIGIKADHTQEKLDKIKDLFGIIIMRTNLPEKDNPPKTVYLTYKRRWSIETHYNFVDNVAKFVNLKTEDYYVMQGIAFLVLIVGQIKGYFYKKLRASSNESVQSLSLPECLAKVARTKFSQHPDKTWHTSPTPQKYMQIFVEMGVDIAKDIKKLNAGTY